MVSGSLPVADRQCGVELRRRQELLLMPRTLSNKYLSLVLDISALTTINGNPSLE